MRVRLLVLGALAAVAAGTGAAAANEQTVFRVGDGSCPSGYTRVASYERTWLCVRQADPDVVVQSGPCAAGYTDVGVASRTVCVKVWR